LNTAKREYSASNQGSRFLLVKVGFIYATIFSISAAITALAFRTFKRMAPPEISGGPELLISFILANHPTNFVFCIAKTLAICIFLDLLVRLGAVLYFDPLDIWKKMQSQTRQESSDSRYAWITSSLRVFFPIVMGCSWAIFITTFLDIRRATHKEYRIGIFPFVLFTIFNVVGTIVAIKRLYWDSMMRAVAFVRRDPKTTLQRTGVAIRKWWIGQPDREIQLELP